jgi:site-specific DNA-methyltransferase (adenine-specific)
MPELRSFLDGRVVLHPGDCMAVIQTLDDASVDSVVTDPPYALASIVKRFGKPGSAPVKNTDIYQRASAGFMGQHWDTGETAFNPAFWAEVLRVLKPGGHVIALGGTRTYHRLVCAIEDARFEIRDQLAWVYGSGFPKSHNAGNGWGTALKPAFEPICLARKPLIGTVVANVLTHGTGALNVDGCRVATDEDLNGGAYVKSGGRASLQGDERTGAAQGMFQPGKTVGADYVQPLGRWPANLIHDGSDEVLAAFPDTGVSSGGKGAASGDAGSAARFFYTAKADASDRAGSKHPTVKPLDLMQWLVRLVTPKGGTVLDPFAGTGTTAEAAWREGCGCVLIERETEYQADIERRIELMVMPAKRAAIAKGKGKPMGAEGTPLFK